MRLFLSLVLSVSLLTGCAFTRPASKKGPVCQNVGLIYDPQKGAEYHWERSDFPLTLLVHPNLVASWGWAIDGAVKIWNARVGFDMFRIVPLGVDASLEELFETVPDGVIPLYGMDEGELTAWLGARVLGVTFIDADEDGRMHNAPVIFPLNGRAHWPPTGIFTAIHELGHVLGLEHDPCKESIMYYSDYPGAYKVLRILMEDVNLLRELYAPTDAEDPDLELKIPRFSDWRLFDETPQTNAVH